MTLQLENEVVDGSYLWQYDDEERTLNVFDIPKKTHLLFGIFILDPFLGTQLESKLSELHSKLEGFLKDWNTQFPWTEFNGIQLTQDTILENGVKYILGQICVEDNVKLEEQLVVTLLRKFQNDYCVMDQVFIKICDTDGDFLMMECHDILPVEFNHPKGNNRLWLYQNCFKLIPLDYKPDTGLTITESLDFLTNSYYRCLNLQKLQIRLDNLYNINKFPNQQLANLGALQLEVNDSKIFKIWANNPQIITYLIKNLFCLTDKITIDKLDHSRDNSQILVVVIPKNHADLLSSFIHINKLYTDSIPIQKIVSSCLQISMQSLIDDKTITINDKEIISHPQCKMFEDFKYDQIQLLDDELFSDTDADKPDIESLDIFSKIFTEKDIDKSNATGPKNGNSTQGPEKDFQEIDTESDNDQEANNFFKEQNIDIDEDDFFEFFIKEALKLKQNDIDQLRSDDKIDTERQEILNSNDELNEKEKEAMRVLDEYMGKSDTKEDISIALQKVFESLSVGSSGKNPVASLLRNMSTWEENDEL